MSGEAHEYLSTACWHELNDDRPELHASCRQSCKFGDESCRCPNHPENDDRPAPPAWVDQAREVARRLLDAVQITEEGLGGTDPELRRRIRTDPDLFWLRGEEQPPGEWRPLNPREDLP